MTRILLALFLVLASPARADIVPEPEPSEPACDEAGSGLRMGMLFAVGFGATALATRITRRQKIAVRA